MRVLLLKMIPFSHTHFPRTNQCKQAFVLTSEVIKLIEAYRVRLFFN